MPIRTLTTEELKNLCNTAKDVDRATLLFKIYRFLGLEVMAVDLDVNGKTKPLLYVKGTSWLIDLNNEAAWEFLEDASLQQMPFQLGDSTVPIISNLIEPYVQKEEIAQISVYRSLFEAITMDDDRLIVSHHYFASLLGKEVHRYIGSIDATRNNKFCSRIEVESLLGYPQDYDSYMYEVTGHLCREGIQSEDHNKPELYIYSLHQYGYSLGFAKDGTIREITTNTNFSDMTDGQKRLIFVPFNFEQYIDFDQPFDFNDNPAVDDWFEKERNVPLEFVGEYALDLAESNQEGCLVWRRINTIIRI